MSLQHCDLLHVPGLYHPEDQEVPAQALGWRGSPDPSEQRLLHCQTVTGLSSTGDCTVWTLVQQKL